MSRKECVSLALLSLRLVITMHLQIYVWTLLKVKGSNRVVVELVTIRFDLMHFRIMALWKLLWDNWYFVKPTVFRTVIEFQTEFEGRNLLFICFQYIFLFNNQYWCHSHILVKFLFYLIDHHQIILLILASEQAYYWG